MLMIEKIREKLTKLGHSVRVGGPATEQAIASTSAALGIKLPQDFILFAKEFGWLEIDNVYIFGIPADPDTEEGSSLRMTLYARREWSLPSEFIAFYSSEDEVLWCISSANERNKEGSEVLAFSTIKRTFVGKVGQNLLAVIDSYLSDS